MTSEDADGLGSTVRAARLSLGLSQAALARRAGISPSYLSRIEGAAWLNGGPWPSDGVLRALARALNLSSTSLIERRERARGAAPAPARGNGRTSYSVSIGNADVYRALQRVVADSPARATLRVAEVLLLDQPASRVTEETVAHWDALGHKLAEDSGALLYRVCTATPEHFRIVRRKTEHLHGSRDPRDVGNIRTRFCFANPIAVDVVITENEVVLSLPDRRGHPALRACVVVDDPDFVAAARAWYDELVWESTCDCTDVRYPMTADALDAIEVRLSALQAPRS